MSEEEAPSWYQEIVKERTSPLGMGQRVRVDVGECPHFLTWHGYTEQDVTGIVISNEATGGPPDHTYSVFFDRPIRARSSWEYARHELTPIPWPTPEEVVRETLARLNAPSPARGGGEVGE